MHFFLRTLPVLLALCLSGCATPSTLDSRKKERPDAYAALSAEDKSFVDQGRIKVGMSPDAVYLSWGRPADVLESESPQGHVTVWLYHGQTVEEYRYWIGRHLESDYYPRGYVRAEIIFQNGKVASWRTLPRPVQ